MFLELRDKLATFENFFKPFSRHGALKLSNRQARIYLALTVLFALSGYLFLLLFPVLLVTMPVTLYFSIQPSMSSGQWFLVTVQLLLMLLGGAMSYAIYNMRFSLPSGLELGKADFPRLFELLQELGDVYGEPRIDRVVLRDRFDIRIIKTPRNGFAFSTTRTLVIGLPVLLTMSPLDVHALLARRVGQLAGKQSRLNSWLYFLRHMWGEYLVACSRQGQLLAKPVCGFFAWFTPLFRSFSVGIARNSELQADRYALKAINDRDTARGITGQALIDAYLTHWYWPGILQNAKRTGKSETLPHEGMAKIFEDGLSEEEIQAAWKRVEKGRANRNSSMPALMDRLENIGYQKPLFPKALSVTAARFYLGGACDSCIEVIDKRSVKKVRTRVIQDSSRGR